MPDIVALGEPMVEYCATGIGKLSKVDLFKRGWGGDTSNFAVSASRQGLSVGHICRLGDDEFGRSFLDLWESEGMDLSRVIVEDDAWTAIYIISLMEGGSHDFTYYRAGSAASRYSVEDLDVDYLRAARVFHTSGITLAISESSRRAAVEALKIDMEEAARHLREMGVGTVVVKHGGEGCYVSTDKERFTMPGYKIDVVDSTGAGDAFDGAWVKGVLMGWDLRRTATTGLGAVAPIPRYEDALRLIREQDRVW